MTIKKLQKLILIKTNSDLKVYCLGDWEHFEVFKVKIQKYFLV